MTPDTADVVYLAGPRQLELKREPLRALGDADVLCATLVTAISPGTELAAYRGLPALRPGGVYPRLQGYCNVARVLAVGAKVHDLAVGDRVLSFNSHRSHFVMPAADALLRLPDEGRSRDLACTYLYHLGYNACLRAQVRAGSRVLVVGLGALGLTSVTMASMCGAVVFGLSDHASSRALAVRVGAAGAGGRGDLAAVRAGLGGQLADVVISTTNDWADWRLALEAAAPRGTIAVLGFPGRGQPAPEFNPLESQSFYMKQLRIEAVGLSPEHADSRGFTRFNERDNLAYLAGQIMAGRLDPVLLVSGTYRGVDIARAYDDLDTRRNSPITYLLTWNED